MSIQRIGQRRKIEMKSDDRLYNLKKSPSKTKPHHNTTYPCLRGGPSHRHSPPLILSNAFMSFQEKK